MLPPRPFVLPGVLGWIANLIGISYVIVTTVLFLFPPDLPVTGSNMSTFPISLHTTPFSHAICRPLLYPVIALISCNPRVTDFNRLLHRRLHHRPHHLHNPVVC